jgi:hypothetical protein
MAQPEVLRNRALTRRGIVLSCWAWSRIEGDFMQLGFFETLLLTLEMAVQLGGLLKHVDASELRSFSAQSSIFSNTVYVEMACIL